LLCVPPTYGCKLGILKTSIIGDKVGNYGVNFSYVSYLSLRKSF